MTTHSGFQQNWRGIFFLNKTHCILAYQIKFQDQTKKKSTTEQNKRNKVLPTIKVIQTVSTKSLHILMSLQHFCINWFLRISSTCLVNETNFQRFNCPPLTAHINKDLDGRKNYLGICDEIMSSVGKLCHALTLYGRSMPVYLCSYEMANSETYGGYSHFTKSQHT